MNNSLITKFDDIEIIAGNDYSMEFEIFDESNNPIDLTDSICKVTLAPVGNLEYSILTKEGIIFGANHNCFKVYFAANETRELYMKYIYQPTIIDRKGKEFCRAQGVIYLSERTKEI